MDPFPLLARYQVQPTNAETGKFVPEQSENNLFLSQSVQ